MKGKPIDCCGHNKMDGSIVLEDGRELRVITHE